MISAEPWRVNFEKTNAITLFEMANQQEYPHGRPKKLFILSGGLINVNNPQAPPTHGFFHCHCPGQRHEMVVLPKQMYDEAYSMIGYDNRLIASIHAWRGGDAELLQRWIKHLKEGAPCPVKNQ